MECREVRELAESFVAGQLLVETNHAIVAHLTRCAQCRADIEGLQRLRFATRRAFTSSRELRPRQAFLEGLTPRLRAVAGRQPGSVRHKWLAAAAALLLVVAGALAIRGWSAAVFAELLHAAIGDHRFCALTFSLTEPPIPLEDAARRYDAVNAALDTILPSATPLSAGPLVVEARHSCVFEGRRFAHIELRYKQQLISLLVTADEGIAGTLGTTGPSTDGAIDMLPPADGFHVASFRGQRHLVFVVSSLGDADVREVSEAMRGPVSRALAGG